jgi:hypothetical protein
VVAALSLDVERSFACFFAGDQVFPHLSKDGKDFKDFLQVEYVEAWRHVVQRVSDLPNAVGYDIMNEPQRAFHMLTAYAALEERPMRRARFPFPRCNTQMGSTSGSPREDVISTPKRVSCTTTPTQMSQTRNPRSSCAHRYPTSQPRGGSTPSRGVKR